MINNDKRVPYNENTLYTDYNCTVCPVCGKRIKHPYTGHVTLEQIEEDSNTCLWDEVIDEGDSTIGFRPNCRNIHPYTLKSEDNQYIHYDLVELANSWDMSLAEKMDKVISYIVALYKDQNVTKDDVLITTYGNGNIKEITLLSKIENLCIDLGIDSNGQVTITTHK